MRIEAAVRLGIVGRGYWGNVYALKLRQLGIEHWQAGRDWQPRADGIIVACNSVAHYEVAKKAMSYRIPVLIEKPVCLRSDDAEVLLSIGGIALVGHTRLYDPGWQKFKAKVSGDVEAFAGGVTESNPDPYWNWLPHLVAMTLDLGLDPEEATYRISADRRPLSFWVGGQEFRDSPGALEGQIKAFIAAIEQGRPDVSGLQMGLKTVQYVERHVDGNNK